MPIITVGIGVGVVAGAGIGVSFFQPNNTIKMANSVVIKFRFFIISYF